jgi:hypothetical protein
VLLMLDGDEAGRHGAVSVAQALGARMSVSAISLERATTRVTEDADGYTFHYTQNLPPSNVIAWVENERKCCPFLRFTLDMPKDDGPARLRVWGVPGVKAFVAAELT